MASTITIWVLIWLVANIGLFCMWVLIHTNNGNRFTCKFMGRPATPTQAALIKFIMAVFFIPLIIKAVFFD